jgi:NNP family nitrate/nitrite transporter-like MFS transporter
LEDIFRVPQVTAGLYAALFAGLCTVVRPIGGAAADKWRPMQMLQWIFIGITVFAVIITLTFSNQSLFIFGIVGAGLIAGFGNGVIFKMVPYVSQGNTGAVTGFVGALGGLGGFFPPLLVGWIHTWTGSYRLGIVLLALTGLVCWYALWRRFIHGDVHIVK